MAVQISGNDITVPRDGTFTRNVTIGGTLTYEDVTNIDSVGLVTARTGIEIGARPGVAASISIDGNMIVSGISTFGGDVQVADKIIHDGDTNTSIRFPAADTVTISTADNERLRITSAGLVGIGQATPTHTLHVDSSNASDTTTTAFFKGRIVRFDGSASANSPRLNLSLDGTDKSSILLNRTDNSLAVITLSSAPIICETNDVEALRIDPYGRVLIGGTSAIIGSSSEFNEIVLTGKTRGAGITLQDTDANTRFQIRTDDAGNDLGTTLNASTNHPIKIRTNNTERVSIGSSGIVRTPYQVAFCVTGSADNLDLDAGDKVAFNNIAAGGGAIGVNRTTYNSTTVFNTTNYEFTAPVAGLYLFTVSFYFRGVNGSVTTQFVLAKNGTEISHSNHYILFSAFAVEGLQPNGSQILDLAAGDVITVHRRTAGQSGTSRVYMPHSYFSGCLIG